MDDIEIEKIAIIGMSGRFPGADSVNHFWQNLINGVESLTTYTDEELLAAGEDPEAIKHPNYVKTGTVLANAGMFDAAFFDFSPKEALYTNPQQRLFLEISWEALENSGYRADNYPGAIGVFGGTSNNNYSMLLYQQSPLPVSPTDRFQIMMGNDPDFLATRVAYKLNLKGPALTIQTACSSSLVAIHQACQSLLTYQCDMALSGGVCVHLHQGRGYYYQEGMIFSPDGHCRAFDAKAQGTVFGQGAGVVVLKRLSEATADNDTILAVISGSAINNDGAMKVGITAPSVDGQAEVVAMAQAIAEVEADDISYIEAHGTGTPLGDPIEIEALIKSFRESTNKKSFCAIGSVKTNIGHLDAAAGVCGLIKTTLALHHKQIPPSLHYSVANPNITFTDSPFYVNSTLQDWQRRDNKPRRAGVSSFGIGGTNAHAILDEAPVRPATISETSWQVLPLSARSSTALQTMATNLAEHIAGNPEQELADIAYTLQVGRKPFRHRCFTVCSTKQNGAILLQNSIKDQYYSVCPETQPNGIVFMFSGQGSQYVNMTRDLYDSIPFYREQVDYCASKLQIELGLDIRDILFPTQEYSTQAEKLLKQTNITQPALFLIEYSLAQLWMHWGIKPTAMVGHSIGEYVAACLAGVFSLDDALELVTTRGRLMHSLPLGSMLTIAQSTEEIKKYLQPGLSLAVINGDRRCVVSGTNKQIELLQKQLDTDTVNNKTLQTSHAFHSHLMEPILDEFTKAVSQVQRSPAKIPFVSNVTGTWITETETSTPGYWANHLRQTVNFYGCLETLLESQADILLEVGPGQTLSFLSKQHPKKNKEHIILSSTKQSGEETNDQQVILQSLGQLWLAGVEIDWQQIHTPGTRSRIPLPTYPFERQSFFPSSSNVPPKHPVHIQLDTQENNQQKYNTESNNSTMVSYQLENCESLILSICRNLLVDCEELSLDDNFFDMGGDSLLALQFTTEIEAQTGTNINPDAVLLNTLRQLAEQCISNPPAKPTPPPARPTSTPKRTTSPRPFYFGPEDQFLFGVHHAPSTSTNTKEAILLCYPLGHEYMRTHWTFQKIATILSEAGYHVLRFEYYGTGDSSGDGYDSSVNKWQDDILIAIKELKKISRQNNISIVGFRFGATLAAQTIVEELSVQKLILVDPMHSGAEYLDKIISLQREKIQNRLNSFPYVQPPTTDEDICGFLFPQALQNEISQCNLKKSKDIRCKKLYLIISQSNSTSDKQSSFIDSICKNNLITTPDNFFWNDLHKRGEAVLPTATIKIIKNIIVTE